MTIATQIIEEACRYRAFYGQDPKFVFIGQRQQTEIDAMIDDMKQLGLWFPAEPIPRARVAGMAIFRVDAESHLSFGLEQPSPCG